MKIAADLGKQQELDADPKSILQIDFTGNLDRAGNIMLFILKKSKRSCFGLFTRTCEDFCQKNNPCKIQIGSKRILWQKVDEPLGQ